MVISEKASNKIYDILVEIGANERYRKDFVRVHSTDENQLEWRFQGKLGFGGKFWNDWNDIENRPLWRVTCYSEDKNPETLQIIEETDKKLDQLYWQI
jgi:hypothetical protein